MSVTFTTDTVSPSDRIDYWHSISCSTYIEYECTVGDRPGFGAHITAAPLADLALSICDNTPLIAERTARHVARTDTDWTFVGLILNGTKHIEQAAHEGTAHAGDFYLADAGRPFVLTCSETKSELVLAIPRPQLAARLGGTDAVTARVVPGLTGSGALASSYLRRLYERLPTLTATEAIQAANQAVDLVALALTHGSRDTVMRLSSAAATSRLRLHDAIDENFLDSTKKCEDLASTAGMSMRYANLLLAQEGTSLERLVLRKRLEKSRSLLRDPSCLQLRIGEIAKSVGFDSPSHFARTFKEAFGVTARDYCHENCLCPRCSVSRSLTVANVVNAGLSTV